MPFYIYRGDNFMNNLFKRSLMLALTLCLMLVCFMPTIVLADTVDYDFTQISGFNSWSSTYSKHDVVYTEGTVSFASANKQSSTITTMPVTKGQPVTFVLNDTYAEDYYISSIVFECEQWTTKTQTITLNVSSDSGANYNATTNTSSNFTLSATLQTTNTNAVKFTFSNSSNQVGIKSLSVGLTSKANALEKLASPTNVSISNNVVSFTAVANASKYQICLYQDGTNDCVISNLASNAFDIVGSTYSYTLPSLSGEIDYTVKVMANGDNVSYLDSDYSTGAALSKETFTSGYNKDSIGSSNYTQFDDLDSDFSVSNTTMVLAPNGMALFENAVKSIDKVVIRAQSQCNLTLTTNTSVAPISEKKSSTYIYTYNMNDVNEFMIENNGENDAKLYQLIIYYTYPEGLHNISYVLNGGTNAVGNPTTYTTGDGTTAISPATKYGYVFNGWYTNSNLTGDAVTEISNLNTENITLYAKFTELAWHKFLSLNTVGSLKIDFTRTNIQNIQGYFLVEDASDLSAGDQIIIAASGSNYAMGELKSNNIGQVAITKTGQQLTYNSAPLVLTLVAGSKDNTFALYDGEHYLYAASSSSNYLKSDKTEVDDNASFAITISDGNAAIVAQGNYTRNTIRYNSGSSLFACYASGQNPVAIYKYESGQTCDYQFNQVDMRFGIDKVTTALYNELGNSVEYGIAAVQASTFDVEQGSTEAPANYIICTNVADVEGGKTFALLMQNIPQQARSTVITARAFVKIDGKYYYANAATYSVKTLAAEYVSPSADKSGYLNEVGMLQALSE